MRYNNMDPWETAFIVLATTIGIFMVSFGLFRNQDSFPPGLLDIPLALVTFLGNLMPFALIAYGIAGDMINQDAVRLSIPSIAALGSIFVVGITSKIIATNGGVDLSKQETGGLVWCTIPGLESVESPYFPTAIMSTAIIGFYYMCWAWSTPSRLSWPLGLFFSIVYLVQLLAFMNGECAASYMPPFGGIVGSILISTVLGILIGTISWASTGRAASLSPFNIPLGSPSAASGSSCLPGENPIANGCIEKFTEHFSSKKIRCNPGYAEVQGACVETTTTGGHSQQVQGGDENTFVAELYKNGQLVTDSIA
jgi:hypothetical protein